MASTAVLRAVARQPSLLRSSSSFARASASSGSIKSAVSANSMSARSFTCTAMKKSGPHDEETFEEFTDRFEKEFDAVQDVFELQRNLNNSFAYDLVPSTTVITAALRAARRVNDYPTAVRIFEGIEAKVENRLQYEQYLEELEPLRKELGIELRETLYPELGRRA